MNPETTNCTDSIEKQIILRAPRERVWRAISDSNEFGSWFGVNFEGPFVAGATVRGVLVMSSPDSPYNDLPFEFQVETIEPEKQLSFRWHPFAIDRDVDYSGEPTTLVVFSLEDSPEGVVLTVTESGFDRIPLARRAKAFAANEEGWAIQVERIAEYVSHAQ